MKRTIYKVPELTVMYPELTQVICVSATLSIENYNEETINW